MVYRIAFIGACFPDDILNGLINRGEVTDIPANVFGWKIVSGLISSGQKVNVINEHKRFNFPNGPLFIKREVYRDNNIICYPNLNIKYIDKLIKPYFIYKELINCKPDIIIVYSLHSPYLRAALRYTKKYGNKVFSIVPDLPQYMFEERKGLGKKIKEIDCKFIFKMLKKIDGFIVLTKQMKDALGITVPFEVIEGIASNNQKKLFPKEIRRKRYILYSGALSEKYGVGNLVKAYARIDTNVELWLCGQGDYVKKLHIIKEKDKRIKYLGLVNRDQLFSLQRKALLLVNPRCSNDKYTKYSFPSKTMEYLQSGTPVMMERLDGIPDEYYKFIIEVKNHEWDKAIYKYLKTPLEKINEIGRNGQIFVMSKKSVEEQGKKIFNFLDSVMKQY